jgi:hypothetical protein
MTAPKSKSLRSGGDDQAARPARAAGAKKRLRRTTINREELGFTDALPVELRKKRVWALVKLMARRLSSSERAEVLLEWEQYCVAHGLDGDFPLGGAGPSRHG